MSVVTTSVPRPPAPPRRKGGSTMSHRLAYPSNLPVPIAITVKQTGNGRVLPLYPKRQAPAFDPRTRLMDLYPESDGTIALAHDASIEALAVDRTPLDPRDDEPSDDFLWLHVSFSDPLGRRIELSGRRTAGRPVEGQCFGGVATRLAQPVHLETAGDPPGPRWLLVPLLAWCQLEIRVDETLTDSGVLGAIRLIQEESSLLRLTVYPRVVDAAVLSRASPVQAAEELGTAGWCIEWQDVEYLQVPLVPVRAERGDTLLQIAREMSVDPGAVIRANSGVAGPDEPLAGQLVHVPLIVRAASAVARRARATALTWKEIIRGWTTLN